MVAPADLVTFVPSDPTAVGAAVVIGLTVLAILGLVGPVAYAYRDRLRGKPPSDASDATARRDPSPTPPGAPRSSAITAALARTRAGMRDRFDALFARPIDESLFDELETALLSADVGMVTTNKLMDSVRAAVKGGERDAGRLRELLRKELSAVLTGDHTLTIGASKPWVILVVGVNGSGKTTTIGKLAARLQKDGKKVLMAAGDTFRAAAIEQLTVWSERAGCDIVATQEGADPGAVVFDALQKAVAKGHDVVIVDTAGRLQTKKPLMDQLSKLRRVVDKVVPGGPHETLLVIDGTMGQNAMSQAKLFHEATPLSGIVVTKLDGTAKGGMVLALSAELGLPVKLVGVGEKIEDLRPFDTAAFVEAIA